MDSKPRKKDVYSIILLFAAIIGYCLYGTLSGGLYLPSKYGSGGVYLTGLNAWLCTLGPVLICLGILIRIRFLKPISILNRTTSEFVFLGAGAVIIAIGLL